MSIRPIIAAALDAEPEATSEAIADKVLRIASEADLLPLVVAEVELQRRAIVRRNERAVTIKRLGPLLANAGRTGVIANDETNQERLLDLMRRVWKLGDGSQVQIGQATLEEVRQRLDMLRKQHAGLGETIEILESVEAELVRSGARCLNELLSIGGSAA